MFGDTMGNPQIEMLPLSALTAYDKNSRTHSPEQVQQVVASIREFGFTNPVLIDASGEIIAGHGRVMAAASMGLAVVPCIRLSHLSEAQKRAYVIADNKLAENSGWDEETLRAELACLRDMDFDLDLTGFDLGELNLLFASGMTEEGLTDPDDLPDLPVEPITNLGDLWILGKHRLLCGDSTSIDCMKTLLGGGTLIWSLLTRPIMSPIKEAPRIS